MCCALFLLYVAAGMPKSVNVGESKCYAMKKNLFYGGLVALGLQLLSACATGNLEEEMTGLWQGERIVRNDEGTPYSQDVSWEFRHTAGGGNVFTESFCVDLEEKESGLALRYRVNSSISGTWRVEDRDLCLTYDLGSLEVTVDNLDMETESLEGYESATQLGMLEILSLFTTGESLVSEEKLEGMYYESLRVEYVESNNKRVAATDVEVRGNTMTCLLDDGKGMRLYRVANH